MLVSEHGVSDTFIPVSAVAILRQSPRTPHSEINVHKTDRLDPASMLNQNVTGPIGPVTPKKYWSYKTFTGPMFF